MSALQQHVRRTIRRHGLIPPGSRVVIGLSGGSDSVGLTFLLRDLSEHGGFSVAGLAHLNHGLRPTAARDEQFCRELAARLTLPVLVEAGDVLAAAARDAVSVEDAARRIRYAFLARAMAVLAADCIAVGHTQDDQAETFLMKLIRGAGLTGLGGVYPRRGAVIRPLLDVSRAELRADLNGRGETWVEDETNEDLGNPRNRIRHRVLPELDAALGGGTRPNIARAAALAREDGEWLDALADEQFAQLAQDRDGGVTLDAGGVVALARPVARRVILRALRRIADGREVGQEHVEAVLAMAAGHSGGIDVPGGRVEPSGGKLVLLEQKAYLR